MNARSEARVMNKINILSRSLPNATVLLILLTLLSIGTGILSVALINHDVLNYSAQSVLAAGVLTGVLVVLLPTLLTVVMVRSIKRYMKTKHILIIAMIGALSYCIFVSMASAVYVITSSYTLANAVVLVGDASIFAWWFFVSKVVLGQKKRAVGFSLIQPIINLFVYTAASGVIFTFSLSLTLLLIKLAGGIFVFLVVSYMILYLFERPIKRNLGFSGVDAFSEIVQNWLFDVDVSLTKPFGKSGVGKRTEVGTQTVVFKNKKQKIKAIMFVPQLHYGPVGTIGGSNFPYVLERYATARYNATTLIMHPAINEDNNPASSSQFGKVKEALDGSIADCGRLKEARVGFSSGRHNDASVSLISIGKVDIATFTRAPRITEDVSPEAATLFDTLLSRDGRKPILIDAHNSRFESAPHEELSGVKPGSRYMDDYKKAIESMGAPTATSKRLMVGAAHVEIFNALGMPVDLAPGNLNVVLFKFNGFKRAMLQFNANNMLPALRDSLLKHVRERYGIDAEVYTTDTHYVNSIQRNASNVLGRSTKYSELVGYVDNAMDIALSNTEPVEAYYKEGTIRNFYVWGPDVREKAIGVLNDVISVARVLVPVLIVGGFVAASWIIALI